MKDKNFYWHKYGKEIFKPSKLSTFDYRYCQQGYFMSFSCVQGSISINFANILFTDYLRSIFLKRKYIN